MLLDRLVNCRNVLGQTDKLSECWADRCAGFNEVTQMDMTQMKRSVVAEVVCLMSLVREHERTVDR